MNDTNPQPRDRREPEDLEVTDRFPGTIITLNPPIPINIEPPRRPR